MTAALFHPLRHAPSRLALACILVGSLAGCGTDTGYPSLAPRPAEATTVAETGTATPPPIAADVALDTQVAKLSAQATAGHAAFEKITVTGCAAVARGARAAQGSEAWIAAQQAISAVDAARAPVLAAVAELDRLVIERGVASGSTVDLSRLSRAQEQANALDAAEQISVAALSAGTCAA